MKHNIPTTCPRCAGGDLWHKGDCIHDEFPLRVMPVRPNFVLSDDLEPVRRIGGRKALKVAAMIFAPLMFVIVGILAIGAK